MTTLDLWFDEAQGRISHWNKYVIDKDDRIVALIELIRKKDLSLEIIKNTMRAVHQERNDRLGVPSASVYEEAKEALALTGDLK